MIKQLLTKLLVCFFVTSCFLYLYLKEQNRLMQMRMMIAEMESELSQIEEKNRKLQFEIDSLGKPQFLMSLLNRVEFSHLKHPLSSQVCFIPEGEAIVLKE